MPWGSLCFPLVLDSALLYMVGSLCSSDSGISCVSFSSHISINARVDTHWLRSVGVLCASLCYSVRSL